MVYLNNSDIIYIYIHIPLSKHRSSIMEYIYIYILTMKYKQWISIYTKHIDTRCLITIWWFNIAIENCHWIYPLKIVIFHSYVSLPEGIFHYLTIVSPLSQSHLKIIRWKNPIDRWINWPYLHQKPPLCHNYTTMFWPSIVLFWW